jgi:hypothetical protein
LARDRHVKGFPEFEQFYIADFPASTQVCLSPLRLPIPPRPHDIKGSTKRAANPIEFLTSGFAIRACATIDV